jgi:hypothetical protein
MTEAEQIAPPAKRIDNTGEEELLTEWLGLCLEMTNELNDVERMVERFFRSIETKRATFIQLANQHDLLIQLLKHTLRGDGSIAQFIRAANVCTLHGLSFDSISKMTQVILLLLDTPQCSHVSVARFEQTKVYKTFSWMANQSIDLLAIHPDKVDGHPTTLVFETLQHSRSDFPIHETTFFQFLIQKFGNPIIDVANEVSVTLIDFAVASSENHPSQEPVSYPVLERLLFAICHTCPNSLEWKCRATKHVFSSNETKQALTLIRHLCVNPKSAIQLFNQSLTNVNALATVTPVKDILDADLLTSSETAKVMYCPCGKFDLSPAVRRRIKDAKIPYLSAYSISRTDQAVARFVEEAPYDYTSSSHIYICKVPVALAPYVSVQEMNGTEVVDYDWLKIAKAIAKKLEHGRFQSLNEVERYLTRMIQMDEEDKTLPRPTSDGECE